MDQFFENVPSGHVAIVLFEDNKYSVVLVPSDALDTMVADTKIVGSWFGYLVEALRREPGQVARKDA